VREIQNRKKAAPPIVLMNFTHVYEEESFWKKEPHLWIDCTDLSGVNGYCDEAAAAEIRKRIESLPPEGLHFIDSGNFHYLSRFWTDKIQRDFVLILFDHHTDMQRSRFGDILSCGSWVRDVLEKNPHARRAVLAGVGEEYLRGLEPAWRERVAGLTCSAFELESTWKCFADTNLEGEYGTLPIYISIDKDVLSPGEEVTDWDQGEMSLGTLKELLRIMIRTHEIIGADICGECRGLLGQSLSAIQKNDSVNDQLTCFLKQEVVKKEGNPAKQAGDLQNGAVK